MIKVVRITGESFDLENTREMPKALILSNGAREYPLYVDDDIAKDILEMMLETLPKAGAEKAPQPHDSERGRGPAPKPASKKPAPVPVQTFKKPEPPPMAQVGGAAAEEEEDENSGFEPGEEYNDPATGAESL